MTAIRTIVSKSGNPYWIITTQNSAYVFGIDSQGYLQNIYWGAKLVADTDYEAADAHHERRVMERSPNVSREEFPVWGDYSYAEPCLKATFADGVRTTLLQYVGSSVEQRGGLDTLVVSLKDPYYPLGIQLIYRPIPEHDLIERSAVLTNTGSDPITLERIMTAAWQFPRRDHYRFRTLSGKWAVSFRCRKRPSTSASK
jgi:alpha-galactosidase